MTMEAVVGNKLLSQAEVNINQDDVSIKKIYEINNILSLNYTIELDAIAVRYTVCEERRKEVQNLLDNYKPKKIKEN